MYYGEKLNSISHLVGAIFALIGLGALLTVSIQSGDPWQILGCSLYGGTVVSNLGEGMGTLAYPWLASAVTRDPILVALVAVAQRLPWLLFTLPAGVITDRVDRRKAVIAMDLLRGVLTVAVAFAVLREQGSLPGPDELDSVTGTRYGILAIVLGATLLLGMAEVLRDNSNQTIMPNIVRPDQLEKANGRIWSIESVTNQFAGPPLGSLLLLGGDLREDRQREDLARGQLGVREISFLVAQVRERAHLMQRLRVVNPGADLRLVELGEDGIALRHADHV